MTVTPAAPAAAATGGEPLLNELWRADSSGSSALACTEHKLIPPSLLPHRSADAPMHRIMRPRGVAGKQTPCSTPDILEFPETLFFLSFRLSKWKSVSPTAGAGFRLPSVAFTESFMQLCRRRVCGGRDEQESSECELSHSGKELQRVSGYLTPASVLAHPYDKKHESEASDLHSVVCDAHIK